MTIAGARFSRALGVALTDVRDWRDPLPAGKWSQFFAALDRRLTVVDVVHPELGAVDRYLNLARSFRTSRATWKAQAGFNPHRLAKLNATLEAQLTARTETYDLLVQLQTLCSPPRDVHRTPYVIYTDTTMALTQKLYPQFAPLASRVARRWEAFEADVCEKAEVVYTFGEFARRSVIEDYGCAADNVVAIGTGANQGLSSLDQKDYSQPIALFVGNDFTRKGGRTLLSAWRTVRERVPGAELVIAGPSRSPVGTGDTGVTYVGKVGRDVLARLYMSARVFVLPSLFEPWGFVFLEAMGHGVACIGTDSCAMPELIDDGVSGRLVAPGSPAALASALIELLSDEQAATTMGHTAYQRVQREFTWDHVIDRFLEHLPARSAG